MRERRNLRVILVAGVMGLALFTFLTYWMGGSQLFTLPLSLLFGAAVLAVMSTQNDDATIAADEAWRQAAPDLPPASDRTTLGKIEASIFPPRPAPASKAKARPEGGSGDHR